VDEPVPDAAAHDVLGDPTHRAVHHTTDHGARAVELGDDSQLPVVEPALLQGAVAFLADTAAASVDDGSSRVPSGSVALRSPPLCRIAAALDRAPGRADLEEGYLPPAGLFHRPGQHVPHAREGFVTGVNPEEGVEHASVHRAIHLGTDRALADPAATTERAMRPRDQDLVSRLEQMKASIKHAGTAMLDPVYGYWRGEWTMPFHFKYAGMFAPDRPEVVKAGATYERFSMEVYILTGTPIQIRDAAIHIGNNTGTTLA
jgi:hypothetical protein